MEEQSITNENFFEKIKAIKDISILRDIKQFYECEYSKFISDSNNVNQKISSLFNLSAIFIGYFITIITFLPKETFLNCNCLKSVITCIFFIGVILLFYFTCRIFILQKFKSGYKTMKISFPVTDAYEDKTFKKNREKEFLLQMIYNYYTTVKQNNILLNEQTDKLIGQHDKLVIYMSITTISLLLMLFM